MNTKNLLIASVCALSLCGGLQAQGNCNRSMLSGTYGFSSTGWATVAPGPVVLPYAVMGAVTIGETGSGPNTSGSGSLTQVLAGQTAPMSVTFNMAVAADCTLTFTATCTAGCHWEGTGVYYKSGKEIDLLFTKVGTGEIPVTSIAVLKQL
jgi:hypothetical protein